MLKRLRKLAVSESISGHFLLSSLCISDVLIFPLLVMPGLVVVLADAVPGLGFDPPGESVSENKCQEKNGD